MIFYIKFYRPVHQNGHPAFLNKVGIYRKEKIKIKIKYRQTKLQANFFKRNSGRGEHPDGHPDPQGHWQAHEACDHQGPSSS
jgi:hypothetical protein